MFILPLQLPIYQSIQDGQLLLLTWWREAILIKIIERLQKIQYHDSEI